MEVNELTRRTRALDAMRPVLLELGVAPYAEGSCLVAFGDTRVLCAATVDDGVPGWRKGSGLGWITAEYAMLPRATRTRTARERSQLGGRTQEIQRLIGRSIRAMLDDYSFGEFTVRLDCDVLQADGGTRTAAITGACVATAQAFQWMVSTGRVPASPVRRRVAAISVGLIRGEPRLDLDYPEDVAADVDMNVVMSSDGVGEERYVEVQGTGEHGTFAREELDRLLDLAARGCRELDTAQVRALGDADGSGAAPG